MMKLLNTGLLALSMVGFANGALAQNAPDAPSTKLETFNGKRGTLLVRDFYHAGAFGQKVDLSTGKSAGAVAYQSSDEMFADKQGNGVIRDSYFAVNGLTIYEPGKAKTKGLQISIFKFYRSNSEDHTSFLDVDEARSLSAAISYILGAIPKMEAPASGSQELNFTTNDDFKIVASKDESAPTIYLSSGRIGGASMELENLDGLTALKTSVDNAVSWLEKQ